MILETLTKVLERLTAEFPPGKGRHSITLNPETKQLQLHFAGYGFAAYLESESDFEDIDTTIGAIKLYMESTEYNQATKEVSE